MSNLDVLKWVLNNPSTLWAWVVLGTSNFFFGVYLGWSVKFINSHWHMVSYAEFDAHRTEVLEELRLLHLSLDSFKERLLESFIKNGKGWE